MSIRTSLTAAALLVIPLVLAQTAAAGPPQMDGVRLIEAWPDQEFSEPILVTHANDGTDMLYVVERVPGRIRMAPKYRGTGAVARATTFLDLSKVVQNKQQGGLLGLAFHPRYASNGLFYVCYLAASGDAQNPHKLVVAECRSDGKKGNAATLRPILEIPKQLPIHNGGGIAFGPAGFLYVGTGDGGNKKEAMRAQNPRDMLGKILRLDVGSGGTAYRIPSDNPWAGMGSRVKEEIWAYGFRNPWRFSWDSQGRMWTVEPGSSGADSREWLSEVRRGQNHGWPYFEGTLQRSQLPANIRRGSLVMPAFEYVRGEGEEGSCGIPGYVYTGNRVPALRGKYVFGDFMKGEVYALDLVGSGASTRGTGWKRVGEVPNLASLGEDAQGELYFCSNELGIVFTLAPK